MLRILSIALVAALFALPAAAIAQDSGLDAYTENPPSAGGDGETGNTGDTDGSASGTASGTASPGSASGLDTTADTDGDGVVSEREAAAAGTARDGQLPATGLDETLVMALVGGLMLAAGLGLRRLAAKPAA